MGDVAMIDAAGAVHSEARIGKANRIRDAFAGVLLLLGLLLPWNVYFGVGIDGTSGWVFGILVLATLGSLAALGVTHLGPRSVHRAEVDSKSTALLRLALNVPYLLLAMGFIVFTVVQAIRGGGSSAVPPGIGPGVWCGVAGAILAAQRVITPGAGEVTTSERKAGRLIGAASLVLGVLAVLFNLYWRTRFVAPNIGDDETGTQNLVVFVAALLYGAAALAPVVVVSRWVMSTDGASRLGTVLAGSSVLVAGVLVWILPVGRDVDAFHGIAQNTSTAGVGFEGYLAWAAAAAIVGTPVVLGLLAGSARTIWRAAVRKCLVLIAIWCGSSAVLRIVDLASASALDLPAPAYNGIALMGFDLVVALLAMWLVVNSGDGATLGRVTSLLFGILFVLSVARVIVGIALVPRVRPLDATEVNAVYGNTLSQQITSTFDVALVLMSLALLVVTFAFANDHVATKSPTPVPVSKPPVQQATRIPTSAPRIESTTEQFRAPSQWANQTEPASAAVTTQIPASTTQPERPSGSLDRVAEVLAESTQRFAAGTTYGTGGSSLADPESGPQR